MTADDEILLRAIIQFRLGPDALRKVYSQSSTQKNEAVNRSIQRYNSRLITFPKNWTGRVHACILNVNEGFRKATEQLLYAAEHKISEDVFSQIISRHNYITYNQKYQKTYRCKKRRVEKRAAWMHLHERVRGSGGDGSYAKGKELPFSKPGTRYFK